MLGAFVAFSSSGRSAFRLQQCLGLRKRRVLRFVCLPPIACRPAERQREGDGETESDTDTGTNIDLKSGFRQVSGKVRQPSGHTGSQGSVGAMQGVLACVVLKKGGKK